MAKQRGRSRVRYNGGRRAVEGVRLSVAGQSGGHRKARAGNVNEVQLPGRVQFARPARTPDKDIRLPAGVQTVLLRENIVPP